MAVLFRLVINCFAMNRFASRGVLSSVTIIEFVIVEFSQSWHLMSHPVEYVGFSVVLLWQSCCEASLLVQLWSFGFAAAVVAGRIQLC